MLFGVQHLSLVQYRTFTSNVYLQKVQLATNRFTSGPMKAVGARNHFTHTHFWTSVPNFQSWSSTQMNVEVKWSSWGKGCTLPVLLWSEFCEAVEWGYLSVFRSWVKLDIPKHQVMMPSSAGMDRDSQTDFLKEQTPPSHGSVVALWAFKAIFVERYNKRNLSKVVSMTPLIFSHIWGDL